MISREQAYKRAFEIKAENLSRKKALYTRAIEDLSSTDIAFADISARLSILGAKTATTALSGNRAELAQLQSEISSLSEKRRKIMAQHNIEEITYDCPLCRDTGYIGGKICDCVKNLAKSLTIEAMCDEIPLGDCSFENFSLDFYGDNDSASGNPKKRMTKLLSFCREYVAGFDPKGSENLLFMGSSGLGKTHLSLAIVSELIKKGYNVIYGSAYNLFAEMEDEHFNSRSNLTYNSALSCDLLVIDDLGGEFVSPYVQSLLYNIINTRLLSKRPVIISTNLNLGEIENRYTPRVASRLIGNYKASRFLGNDIRQIKALENN